MAVFALEEDLKHFGNLLKLILDVSEFHYLQHQSQKIYQYHGKDDSLAVVKDYPSGASEFQIPIKGNDFGSLFLKKDFQEKEKLIFGKLLTNFKQLIEAKLTVEEVVLEEAIIDTLNEGIIACDEAGVPKFSNKKLNEMLGLPSVKLSPEKWAERYRYYRSQGKILESEQDLPIFKALKGNPVFDEEFMITPPGKPYLDVFINAHALFNAQGKKIGAYAAIREVTALNKELNQMDSRFRTIFYQSPLSIQICTKDGKTTLVNPAWKKLWGIPDDLVENYILKDYNMLEDPILETQGVMEFIKRGYAGETTKIPVIRYNTRESGLQGSERFVEGYIYPLKDSFGEVKEVVLIHIDVTDKVKQAKVQNLLSNVSAILNTSLDHQFTIQRIVDACSPDFSEGAFIDMLENKKLKRFASKHVVPDLNKEMSQWKDPSIEKVLTTGVPVFKESSKIIVPLIIRDKTIGVLGLVMSSEQRFFDETSLAYAIEIAKRTSLAIEHVQLYQELQKAIEQRDEFISIASHELKTPITSMKLQYQLIERGLRRDNPQTVDSSVVMKMVDRSNKQLSRITRLVEDMLDISRITSGKLELTLKKTNITELIRDVVHDLSHVLEHLSELIELDLEEGVEAICDEYRIEQVIANLVTNAIRYGNETPIGVKLKKINDIISISVTDHGPGISVENQKRIFGKYERATSKNISGLGLGLFIGQEIIRQHKGTLTVHSDPGKGATFKVTFPANLK